MPQWSVRLVLSPALDTAIVPYEEWPIVPELHAMTWGGLAGTGYEDVPYLTFELEAGDADEAEELAQSLARNMLRDDTAWPSGGLPVAWVAPLLEGQDSHRFLSQAKELYDDERYELAIIAAHVHLEVQMRTLLTMAADSQPASYARRLLKTSPWSRLTSSGSKAAVEILLGVDPTRMKQWAGLTAHVTRRNAVVHEGVPMNEADARKSLSAVEGFWAELASAARPARPHT